MCGIAGWIDWKNDLTLQAAHIQRMADTLEKRGPDAQGQWLSPHAALAHRRLIVIDPETGAQPMVYREGERTYAITYNGEMYNFRELRQELESYGHSFRTRSDTEVLLHAYVQWGEACVEHFNGIFAFGLWDEQQQELLLARDHMGVKPLYYAQRGSTIVFGSELKTLLTHPLIKTEIDATGLAEILTIVHAPGSGIYRNVQELRPGHLAVCREQGMRVHRYWSLRSAPHSGDSAATAMHLRMLLEDIVNRQLISDVPIVTMLSGGLDSSGLTALAARTWQREGRQLHTYSIDSEDSAKYFQSSPLHVSLDAPWVQRVSEYVRTEHHTVVVHPSELIENVLVPLYAHDYPTLGQATSSLYLLFKAMKRDATVTLSGESADEIFGGYPWFHSEAALNATTFPWLPAFHDMSKPLLHWLSPDLRQKLQPMAYLDQQYRQMLEEVPRLAGEDALAARRREMFYMNITRFLPLLLDRKDRMSMATGFEARVPFCDHRLVQYVWNIPWEIKMVDGMEKGILRRAFADVLPHDVLYRRKSAYPSTQHPAYDQTIRTWARHIVDDPHAPIQPLIDATEVRAILDKPNLGFLPFADHFIQVNEWLAKYQVSLVL